MVSCPSAPLLAGELRRAGLRVHEGRIATLASMFDARRAGRARRPPGAIAVDMESSYLLAGAAGRPAVVVRAVSDTADRPLLRPGVVTGGIAALRSLRLAGPALAAWAAAAGPRQVLLAGPRSFCAGRGAGHRDRRAGPGRPARAAAAGATPDARSTCASRSCITRMSCPGSSSAARSSWTSSARCPTAPRWCSPRTASRPPSGPRPAGAAWPPSTRPARWWPRCTPRPAGSSPTATWSCSSATPATRRSRAPSARRRAP